MSVLPKESIQVVAQAYGFPDLEDDVAVALASDLEYRLREITQEACKFMRHSKRRRLTTDDVNNALRHRNLEPIYGYSLPQPEPDRLEQLFKRAGSTDVFYIPDQTVDLAEFVSKTPMPKLPLDVTFSSHWLAIDGRQPAIPENPPVFRDQTEAAGNAGKPAAGGVGAAAATGAAAAAAAEAADARSDVVVKQKVKHVLSRELQMYYQNITEGLLGPDVAFRDQVLESVRGDPGLHQLLPFFAQFVMEQVTSNLKNLPILLSMMKFVGALLANPNVFMDPYLHQIMPSIMTCVVGKTLCANPATDDHWSLRQLAAQLVATICSKFRNKFPEIQSRVTKTLVGAFLDHAKPLSTHFGAISCLSLLGPSVVNMFIIDNVPAYGKFLDGKLKDSATRSDAERVYNALLEAVGKHLRTQQRSRTGSALPPTDEAGRYAKLHEFFGEKLAPYTQ